jgi:hypothetical protein
VGVTTPPDRRTRTLAVLLLCGGAVALVFGAVGIDRAALLSAKIPYVVSGGIGGVVLIAVGLQLVAGTALGRERDRLDDIEAAIRAERSEISLKEATCTMPSSGSAPNGTGWRERSASPPVPSSLS